MDGDDGNVGLQDARFLGSDGFDGIAEIGFVIVSNRRDDAEFRCDDVGRVETAAEAYFDYTDLAAVFEVKQRHSSHGFEVGRVGVKFIALQQALGASVNGVEFSGEIGVGDWSAIDLNSLGGFHQMRRRIEAGAEARFAQNGGNECTGRALPIRARYMDETLSLLRMPKAGQELFHALQAEFRARFNFVAKRV